MVLWRRDRSSGGGDARRVRNWKRENRERERENKHSKLEKLEQLEKLEKPERECHVSMETWWGNSASGLVGSISSRLLPRSNVNVFHIFPTRPRQAFSPLVQRREREREREESPMAERRSEKNLFFPPRRFDTFEFYQDLATYHFRAHNPIPIPSHLTTLLRRYLTE